MKEIIRFIDNFTYKELDEESSGPSTSEDTSFSRKQLLIRHKIIHALNIILINIQNYYQYIGKRIVTFVYI